MNSTVRVGVASVIYNDKNEVLIGRRVTPHGSGTYGFPGGHLEMGESPEECAIRETMEEVGVKINNLHVIGFTNDVFDTGKHYITIFIASSNYEGNVTNMEPHKLEGWEWYNTNNLPNPLFLPIENLLLSPYKDNLIK